MVVIIVSVAIRGPQIDMSLKGDQTDRWTFMNPGVFEAIGVICRSSDAFYACFSKLTPFPFVECIFSVRFRLSS